MSAHRCDRWAWEHNWQDDYYGVQCADCGQFYAYGCEPWAPEHRDELDEDIDDCEDEYDEFEDALGNCHAFFDGRVYVCGAVGSEDCDECPFNGELGKTSAECQQEESP